jgi:hypothetical protein
MSECLVLGSVDEPQDIVLLTSDIRVANGCVWVNARADIS